MFQHQKWLLLTALTLVLGCTEEKPESAATAEVKETESNSEGAAEKAEKKSVKKAALKAKAEEKKAAKKAKERAGSEKKNANSDEAEVKKETAIRDTKSPPTEAEKTEKPGLAERPKEMRVRTPKTAKSAVERAVKLAAQDGGNKRGRTVEKRAPSVKSPTEKPKRPGPVATSKRVAASPPIPISHALSSKELREMTGMRFKEGVLEGQTPSPRYNSLYFEGDRKDVFGVAIQLWHEPALKDTRARYEQMKIGYPNVQETGNITNYTFFSHWGKVYHMVFMDLKRRRVATVSSEALTPNQLFTVATRVRDRLLR